MSALRNKGISTISGISIAHINVCKHIWDQMKCPHYCRQTHAGWNHEPQARKEHNKARKCTIHLTNILLLGNLKNGHHLNICNAIIPQLQLRCPLEYPNSLGPGQNIQIIESSDNWGCLLMQAFKLGQWWSALIIESSDNQSSDNWNSTVVP